jgi:hypothetical protein
MVDGGSPKVEQQQQHQPQQQASPWIRNVLIALVLLTAATNAVYFLSYFLSGNISNSKPMQATLWMHRAMRPFYSTSAEAQGECSVNIFIGVLSAAANVEARNTVRETWGAHPLLASSRVMFFVLRPHSDSNFQAVRREAAETGDIFMTSEVYEDYYNITYAVLNIFKVAATMSDSFTHIAKTDDDCFVRPAPLLNALAGMPRQWLYAGSPLGYGSVIRTPGWHYVPYSNWASDEGVRYGFGAGYVLSMDLAKEIAAGAAHVIMPADNLLIIEDVAVGYWVSHVAKEQGVSINYNDSIARGDGCNPDLMFAHITRKPQWQALRCLHAQGTDCC